MSAPRTLPTFDCSAKPNDSQSVPQKPFVVRAAATMLKKNPQLSKHARQLFVTLLALADWTTGELKINGRWLKATVFDRAAEICRDVRMRAMRELTSLGLVTVKRARISRMIDGRRRSFLGEAQYTVHRDALAKNHQNGKDSSKVDLVKSISSTVEEIDSQYLSTEPKYYDGAGAVALGLEKLQSGAPSDRHHHPSQQIDEEDDKRARANSQTLEQVKPGKNSRDEWTKRSLAFRA
jgi:hypothetical protein